MKILITNDDGIDATPLLSLFQELSSIATCWVVAPNRERSCCSHAVTNALPLNIEQRLHDQWTVDGTPADCVRIALRWLRLQPDWVISGINAGGNLGVDIQYSGTVAGAREAALLGCKSMAVSQYLRRDVDRDWKASARCAKLAIEQLQQSTLAPLEFWNINLPLTVSGSEPPSVIECSADGNMIAFEYDRVVTDTLEQPIVNERISTVKYRSNYQTRPRSPDRDVALCFDGSITATKLRADLG